MPRTTNHLTCLTAAILATVAGAATSYAQCGAVKITAASPSSGEQIGGALAYGVSAGGQRLVVGAPDYDAGAFFGSGVVKYFARVGNQWGEIAELFKPGQAVSSDHFGASVGYDGAQVIVGAPGVLSGIGAAYIYEFQGTWTVVATISGSQALQHVGEAVAIDDDFAFVGAPGTDTANNASSGLVSIRKRNANGTWSQVQTVSDAPIGGFEINRELGAALAAQNGLLVIGAPGATIPGSPSFHGYVRIMRRDAGGTYQVEEANFSPGPRRIGANFGSSVATDGTRVAVAAPGYNMDAVTDGTTASQAGTVWVLAKVGGVWTVEDQVYSPSPVVQGRFGSSVSLSGDRLLVGSADTKQAFAFKRMTNGQWALERSYSDEDTAAAGAYASSVAIGTDNIFISDTGDDTSPNTDTGAIYIKPLPTGYSDSCDGAPDIAGTTVSGCVAESTPDYVPLCQTSGSASGKSVWMAWTPTCSGNVIMDTFGSDFDTVMSVHSDCPTQGNPAQIACNDDASSGQLHSLVTFNYTAGTRYLINVRGYGANVGNFTLRINEWQAPSNNECSGATTVANNSVTPFNTCLASTSNVTEATSCGFAGAWSKDVWFNFVPTATGTLVADTCGSTFDTLLAVYAGPCPSGALPANVCNDDSGFCGSASLSSRISLPVTAGQSYRIRVGGLGAAAFGGGQLRVTLTPTCRCDTNASGSLTVQDIFDFLTLWFSNNPAADINGQAGVTVQDIFDFLTCWFGGCN